MILYRSIRSVFDRNIEVLAARALADYERDNHQLMDAQVRDKQGTADAGVSDGGRRRRQLDVAVFMEQIRLCNQQSGIIPFNCQSPLWSAPPFGRSTALGGGAVVELFCLVIFGASPVAIALSAAAVGPDTARRWGWFFLLERPRPAACGAPPDRSF